MLVVLALIGQNLLASMRAASHASPAVQLVKLSNQELAHKGQAHWDRGQLDSALICFSIVADRAGQSL